MTAAVLVPLPSLKSAPASEATTFYPKPGRTPPARLQAVPPPADEQTVFLKPSGSVRWADIARARGELPAKRAEKRATPTAHVPPYLRPGYWRGEVKLGHQLHEAMREEMAKEAKIRACPKSLAALLNTPEWRGSSVTDPTESEIARLHESATRALYDAQALIHAAKGKADKARATAYAAAHQARLDRVRSARRVVHPSGAVLLWLPTSTD